MKKVLFLFIDAGTLAAHYFSLCERMKSNQKKVAQLKHPMGPLTAAGQSGAIKNSSSVALLLAYSDSFIPSTPKNRLCSVIAHG